MSGIDFDSLLFTHNLPKDALKQTTLTPSHLQSIHDDHLEQVPDLERVGDFVTSQLRRSAGVHSLKYRVKNAEHLIAKIIRKRLEKPERDINLDNYKTEITDLVGVRALHLFKSNWGSIHDYIIDTWNLTEKPVANVREGDHTEVLTAFEDRGCKINLHKAGYRSVHYLIESQPTKSIYIAEVQVRTIFEEAWSEVDHTIRYPDDLDNPILAPLLLYFNRLAGSADEISSYIQNLKSQTEEDKRQHEEALDERDRKVAELQAYIESLEGIPAEDKEKIKGEIEEINAYDSSPAVTPPLPPIRSSGLGRASGELTRIMAGSPLGTSLGVFDISSPAKRAFEAFQATESSAAKAALASLSGSITANHDFATMFGPLTISKQLQDTFKGISLGDSEKGFFTADLARAGLIRQSVISPSTLSLLQGTRVSSDIVPPVTSSLAAEPPQIQPPADESEGK